MTMTTATGGGAATTTKSIEITTIGILVNGVIGVPIGGINVSRMLIGTVLTRSNGAHTGDGGTNMSITTATIVTAGKP